MNAVVSVRDADHGGRVRLRPEFAALSPEALLAHFRASCATRWFAVPDPVEAARSKIDDIVAGIFTFNGETHRLGRRFDWLVNPSVDVEWHILLHKFYYATGLAMAHAETGDSRYADRWLELTATWMDAVPPGFIAADVTGRRVQNWIYAYRHFVGMAPTDCVPPAFHERLLASLELQVEHLCANLTPKRNHRTLELYAIFLAGVAFPEFERAATWREFALAELVRNAAADLLPDGVHCELSTDYHHLVVKNWLCVRRLAAMNGVAVPADFDAALGRALDFSMHVHNPSGVVPALSDGDVRSFVELLRQGADLYGRQDWRYVASGGAEGTAPDGPAAVFPHAGYCVLRSGWGEGRRAYEDEHHLVFDCGPLGEGNHGHLDCLSFELAANGRSLVVDPGRYTYSEAGDVNWRVQFRGTKAHNTVSVDGLEQTRYAPKRVGGGTRHAVGTVRHRILGPAPVATLHEAEASPGFAFACGSARSAEYPAVHMRHVAFLFDEYWLVVDRLDSPATHRYEQRFQFAAAAHGAWAWVDEGDARVLRMPGLLVAVDETAADGIELEEGWVSPEYGVKCPAPRLCVSRSAQSAWLATLLYPATGAETTTGIRLRSCEFDAGDVEGRGLALDVYLTRGRATTHDRMRFVSPVGLGAPSRSGTTAPAPRAAVSAERFGASGTCTARQGSRGTAKGVA